MVELGSKPSGLLAGTVPVVTGLHRPLCICGPHKGRHNDLSLRRGSLRLKEVSPEPRSTEPAGGEPRAQTQEDWIFGRSPA